MDLLQLPPPTAFLRPTAGHDPKHARPDLTVEHALHQAGLHNICGVDEAGRGPLAGPVVCAAVVLDQWNMPSGLNDSKELSASAREELYREICLTSDMSVTLASPATIDLLNIRAATLAAMARAIAALSTKADAALIDGNALPPKFALPMWPMIKGDSRSASIAAASIVAKTVRDQLMAQAHSLWPEYGFARHMGYPTTRHREVLRRIGPCPIHRLTFAPVKAAQEAAQQA